MVKQVDMQIYHYKYSFFNTTMWEIVNQKSQHKRSVQL